MKFSIIIYTNKETDAIDDNIKILKNTINSTDEIIVINYNRYHNKYRKLDGVVYHQLNMNAQQSIDMVLSRYCKNDNIILMGNGIKVTKMFMYKVRKSFNTGHIATCRVDILTGNKNVIPDQRLGSTVKPEIFSYNCLMFNKITTGLLGDKSIDAFCDNGSVALKFYNDIKVYNTNESGGSGLTIILPSTQSTLINYINEIKQNNDIISVFNLGERSVARNLNKFILQSKNERIVFINPLTQILDKDLLDEARSDKTTTVYDSISSFNKSSISDNCIISFNRNQYKTTSVYLKSCADVQRFLIGNDRIRYSQSHINSIINTKKTLKTTSGPNTFSIIIPFMYLGDRWELFKASIECLYDHTKMYSNIEIIVHETAPTRFLTDEFVSKYNIKYIYSKWVNHFHRGWSLNVAAKQKASGNIFVFFDADLLITKQWVTELLNCNTTDIKIGWGKMHNLNKNSTDHYIKTGQILRGFDRTRKPSSHGAGGGINIIPKDIFYEVKGWPEEFTSYGGEDNAFNFKLHALGYIPRGY